MFVIEAVGYFYVKDVKQLWNWKEKQVLEIRWEIPSGSITNEAESIICHKKKVLERTRVLQSAD